MWNDPKIGIDWNTIASQAGAHGITPLLSEKDQHHPAFNPDRAYFDTDGIWIGGDWKEGR